VCCLFNANEPDGKSLKGDYDPRALIWLGEIKAIQRNGDQPDQMKPCHIFLSKDAEFGKCWFLTLSIASA
jgi:hypothetical protein